MLTRLRALWKESKGETAVEFGLVAALVTLAAVIAFASMGPRLGF